MNYLKFDRDRLLSEINICTEFEEPLSILCKVIIWTRFGLYIIKLKATLTLNFYGLISKSIGIIYTPGTNVCAKVDKPRSVLCLVNLQTRFGLYIKIMTVTVTLTFDQLTSKSIGNCYTLTQISAKFDEPRSILCIIVYTAFGLYINVLMVIVTLTFNRLISKSRGIIYTPWQMSVSNLTNLCQFRVCLSFGQGLVYIPICRRSL